MATTIETTFQLRRGNAEVWAKNNPVLAAGEPAFELDTGKLKLVTVMIHIMTFLI